MAASCDTVVTCLPSPAASRTVLEADDGVIALDMPLTPHAVWQALEGARRAKL